MTKLRVADGLPLHNDAEVGTKVWVARAESADGRYAAVTTCVPFDSKNQCHIVTVRPDDDFADRAVYLSSCTVRED